MAVLDPRAGIPALEGALSLAWRGYRQSLAAEIIALPGRHSARAAANRTKLGPPRWLSDHQNRRVLLAAPKPMCRAGGACVRTKLTHEARLIRRRPIIGRVLIRVGAGRPALVEFRGLAAPGRRRSRNPIPDGAKKN